MVVYCYKLREVTYGYANNFLVVAERMDKVYYVLQRRFNETTRDPGMRITAYGTLYLALK